jgi:putative RNA 2'-phosphotransferase
MNTKNISRSLTKALRHSPEMFHLVLDKNGWASVSQVLENVGITMEELTEVVDTNDKQRLAFNEDRTKIRANQGHSIEVDLEMKSIQPPHKLYHGTAIQHVDSILKSGLDKRNRHHVHMASELKTATTVGMRSGSVVIFEINASLMNFDGYKFYVSPNGVWLTDHVPAKYLKRVK